MPTGTKIIVICVFVFIFLMYFSVPAFGVVILYGTAQRQAEGVCRSSWKKVLDLFLSGNAQKTFDSICANFPDNGAGGGNNCYSYGNRASSGSPLDIKNLQATLRIDEGVRNNPYTDSAGFWTIGIGHNLQATDNPTGDINVKNATGKESSYFINNPKAEITDDQINKLFEADLSNAEPAAAAAIGTDIYNNLPSEAKQIMVEMYFQMGPKGLSEHKNMVEALKGSNYHTAALEIADSLRYDQLKCELKAPLIVRKLNKDSTEEEHKEFKKKIEDNINSIKPQATTSCRVLRQTKRMWDLASATNLSNTTVAKNLFFPIANGSLADRGVSANFGDSRDSGARCHQGVDIYTKDANQVVAITSGNVLAYSEGFTTCSGGSEDGTSKPAAALLISQKIQDVEYNVLYAELTPDSIDDDFKTKNAPVEAGEILGTTGLCTEGGVPMLHFEVYDSNIKTIQGAWNAKKNVGTANCLTKGQTIPIGIKNPMKEIIPLLQPFYSTEVTTDNENFGDDSGYNDPCASAINHPVIPGSGGKADYSSLAPGIEMQLDPVFGSALQAAIKEADANHITIKIVSGSGGKHTKNSNHYKGTAVDINAYDSTGVICKQKNKSICSNNSSAIAEGCSSSVRNIFAHHNIYGDLCKPISGFPCGDCNHFSLTGH